MGGSVNNGKWAAEAHGNAGRVKYFNALMTAFRSVPKFKSVQVSEESVSPKNGKENSQNDAKSAASTSRCGQDWTAANSQCGASCTNDAQCKGTAKCFKDLSTTPCQQDKKEKQQDKKENQQDNKE